MIAGALKLYVSTRYVLFIHDMIIFIHDMTIFQVSRTEVIQSELKLTIIQMGWLP